MDLPDDPSDSLDNFLISMNPRTVDLSLQECFFDGELENQINSNFPKEDLVKSRPTSPESPRFPEERIKVLLLEEEKKPVLKNSKSPFSAMNAPTLAVEPPTPSGSTFQDFSSFSNSISTLPLFQTHVEAPLALEYGTHDSRRLANLISPTGTFSPSSLSSRSTLLDSPIMSNGATSPFSNLSTEQGAVNFPLSFGVQIARCWQRGSSQSPSIGQSQSWERSDYSGQSSSTSPSSTISHEIFSSIDPNALQPPLERVLNDNKSELHPNVSPFINQTLETGPDGAVTGKYQRPLTSTGRPSHARKTPPGHVKRPRNAFILFRSYACSSNLIPATLEKDHRQISKIVSHMWKNLPSHERIKWVKEAEVEKELHKRLHPDYRYKPVYRKEGVVRKKQSGGGPIATTSRKAKVNKTLQETENTDLLDEPKSPDLKDSTTPQTKTFSELQRAKDEEIRCQAVANVVMGAKSSGINLSGIQMKEKLIEEINSIRRQEASNMNRKDTEVPFQPDEKWQPIIEQQFISKQNGLRSSNFTLNSLQPRRKSQLSRANSAPPPPSPSRDMHCRDLVYNPKMRELSPDFPKSKLNNFNESSSFDGSPCNLDFMSQQMISQNGFGTDYAGNYDYSRFSDPNFRQMISTGFNFNPTPSQELDQLLQNPDFTFADATFVDSESICSDPAIMLSETAAHFYPPIETMLSQQNNKNCRSYMFSEQLDSYTLNSHDIYSTKYVDHSRELLSIDAEHQ
ncbi:hypothetical protein PPACK8108_LOCUS21410 [Phakopsora pachyrhizi]|uniref:HMG box domain-containing protein n=1 Tax=Phakopsora pachyrhizi TaxID=170000 RepID=A0AAV0BHL9_PHAPC|nr:hypothetical protein PPACK8108_LOCUS21410 [Phakopsora pachyrhizi]